MFPQRARSLVVGLQGVLIAASVLAPSLVAADVREGETSVRITITDTTGVRELPPEDVTRLRVFVHEEEERRPGHRSSFPVCQPTTNDAVSIYGLTGWHLPGPFSYRMNTRRAPEAIASSASLAIAAAAQTWAAADADKQLTFAGTTDISRPRYDGNNVVLWKLLPGRTVAAAYVWYHPETGEVLDADMILNTRVSWAVNDPAGDCGGIAGAYDVQAVVTHEFGHWFGLEDLYDASTADLTMHGIVTVGELKKASLGEGDRLGATAVAP